MVAIEDAGWEIRDTIGWMYFSGFPKSCNIKKCLEKKYGTTSKTQFSNKPQDIRSWDGWGTGLKPAWEPIIVARKPIEKGLTIAENVVKWGTGGINVGGCRVEHNEMPKMVTRTIEDKFFTGKKGGTRPELSRGRFPANLIHDGSEEVTELFPNSKSKGHSVWSSSGFKGTGGKKQEEDNGGSAARFFYCAKASKQDRDEGLESFGSQSSGVGALRDNGRTSLPRHNGHPTVKPTKLMAYLCRLVTPPGGLVLDPFAGSGSTGKACKAEGFKFLGIEMNEEYCKIARARIK
jgi:site-specific DNA-methyltransferase (adenine-specific)